jgi:hypothetical protein
VLRALRSLTRWTQLVLLLSLRSLTARLKSLSLNSSASIV